MHMCVCVCVDAHVVNESRTKGESNGVTDISIVRPASGAL